MTEDEAFEVVEDADVETLKQSLSEEKAEAEKYLANWQRSEADFSNYKKRIEQEKAELSSIANTILVIDLLPVLDDLERAFASLPPEVEGLAWVDGVRLIHRKLQGVLEARGLVEIEALGQQFNPSLHEAVLYRDGEEGIVIDDVQKGYKFGDRIIRPAMVVVGKAKEEGVEETAERSDSSA